MKQVLRAALVYAGWLMVVGALGCFGGAGVRLMQAWELADVQARGVDSVARIDGAHRVLWKGAPGYDLDLSWVTKGGVALTAQRVRVTTGFANTLIKDTQVVRLTVPIRYRDTQADETKTQPQTQKAKKADTQSYESVVVVMPDFVERITELEHALVRFIWWGTGLLCLGIVSLWFVFLRNRAR